MRLFLIALLVAIGLWLVYRWIRRLYCQKGGEGVGKTEERAVAAVAVGSIYPRQGRIPMLCSFAIAAMFMGMDWARFWFISKTGVELQLLGLLILWVYPIICATFYWRLNRRLATICALVNICAAGVILFKATHFKFLFFSVNAAAF